MDCREIAPALSSKGVSPFQACECSAMHCTKVFALIDGVAFPGQTASNPETRFYFFCSNECYLRAMPPEACWRA
jgi:hypothetical protein